MRQYYFNLRNGHWIPEPAIIPALLKGIDIEFTTQPVDTEMVLGSTLYPVFKIRSNEWVYEPLTLEHFKKDYPIVNSIGVVRQPVQFTKVNNLPVWYVDNCLQNIEEVMKEEVSTIVYNQHNVYFDEQLSSGYLNQGIVDMCSKIVQKELEPVPNSQSLSYKLNMKNNMDGKYRIHADNQTTHFAGVLYLSKDHPEVDGTNVYINHSLRIAHYSEIPNEAVRRLHILQGLDETKWEKIASVPYKFNRFVLMDGGLFHREGELFDGRLVHRFFLRIKH